jgi:hypothetical protein
VGIVLNSLFEAFRSQGNALWMMIIYGITGGITAGIALLWSKHPVRWILVLLTVGVILLLVLYGPKVPELDDRLPHLFLPPLFPFWVALLTLVALYTSFHLVGGWIRAGRGIAAEPSDEASKFPDLEAAWDEIQIQLSHARYDAGQQKVFLILAPDESLAEAMIQSSGHQFFAQAPSAREAPIHAYATADGLFLSFAGASAWGRRDEEGTARLKELCRKLLALNPEQPVLRGVAVLYPMEKAASPEMIQKVGPLRNDLQTIRAELGVRCPTIAVLCLHESYSGFNEFAARMPVRLRLNRSGFSVPMSHTFDRGLALQGFRWLAQWFYSWSLSLMKEDFFNKEGNNKLVTMNAQLWRDLPALSLMLESSFSTHARAEPILVRGCYFAACGPEPESHAFIAGLIKGGASKMIADAANTSWSHGADEFDRRYRLMAWGLGLATAAVALPIWFFGVISRPGILQSGKAWVGWAALVLLALVWAVGLLYPRFRGKEVAPAKP